MKKRLRIIAVMSIVLLSLTACGGKKNTVDKSNVENNNPQISTEIENKDEEIALEPINSTFNTENTFAGIESITKLDATTKLSEEEIKSEFNFEEYQGLEMEIRSKENEENISEVAIVKLGDVRQSEEIISVLLKRKENLQKKYSDNEQMLEIINNPDNVIKQQAGVVIFIISENAKEIETKIDELPR